jgi:YD repeat-containing protein
VSLAYDGNGLVSAGNFAGGDALTFSYDLATRRPTGSSQTTATAATSATQRMSARALVDWETFTVNLTSLTRSYGYSSQRFLTGATDAQASYRYGFDGLGLSTSVTRDGATRAIVESSSTLTAGTVTYGFDGLRRTVSRVDSTAPAQALTLTYGPDGQVATASRAGVTCSFLDDEAGQRILKRTGATPTAAYLDEGYVDAGGLTERYERCGAPWGMRFQFRRIRERPRHRGFLHHQGPMVLCTGSYIPGCGEDVSSGQPDEACALRSSLPMGGEA